MKITTVCSRFPYPIEKGDKLRIYHQLKALSHKHDIQLIALSMNEIGEDRRRELAKYCSEIHVFELNRIKQYFHIAYRLWSSLPLQIAYFYNPIIKRDMHNLIMQFNPDVLYCQLIRAAEYVKALPIPKVLDYMDAFSLGYERRAEEYNGLKRILYNREVQRLKHYEQSIFYEFDGHSIISEQDRDAIDVEGNDTIKIVRNGVDTAFFKPLNSTENTDKNSLLFVGNMGYEPNFIAAQYLLDKIVPAVEKLNFSPEVIIAGARPPQALKKYVSDSIHITGWIEDIRDAYMKGTIFVAPLFTGSGLQNKILEAMAMELPIVTTSIVNDSIGADKNILFTADNEKEFVSSIDILLRDRMLRKRMGENGRKFAIDNFSWHKTTEKLESLLRKTKEA